MQPGIESRLQNAIERLGDVEAEQVLSGAPSQTREAHEAVMAAREAFDALSASIAGLRRRRIRQEDEILSSAGAFIHLFNEFVERCHAHNLQNYKAAVSRCAEALAECAALSDALGINFIGAGVEFVLPETYMKVPFSMFAGQNSRIAQEAREAVLPTKEVFDTITRLVSSIESERKEQIQPVRRDAQPNALGDYPGLSDEEWKKAQLSAPRDMSHVLAS